MHRRDQGPRGGAEHLARIHGTEEDKVNCPFYFKIGACRHGDRCSRMHHKPPFSQTIIVPHMWQNPFSTVAMMGGDPTQLREEKIQDDFDAFYEEIFDELSTFGTVEDIQVCENLGDHMVGNVYVKFSDEEEAEKAVTNLYGRYYAGRPLTCEFCPVTDFREARCRQYDEGNCGRGGYCNFMHIREPSRELRKHLEKEFDFKGGKMKGTGSMAGMNMGGGRRGPPPPPRDRPRDDDRRHYGRPEGGDRGYGGRDRYGDDRDRRRDRSRDRDRRDSRDRRDMRDDRPESGYGSRRE